MRFTEISESYLDKYKKYTRPVTKTTPKIEKTSNPLGRTTNHVEWKVTGNTGEVRRFQSKQEAQDYYDSCTKNVTEGYEPGDKITWYHSNQYPEIEGTIVGWKDGHLIVKSVDPSPRNTEKTVAKYRVPKNNILSHTEQGVAEGLLNELDMFAPVTTYVRLANGEYVAASWRRNQAVTGGNSASFIDIKPLAPNVAKQLGLDKRLNDPDKNQNGTASIASGGGVQSSMPFSDKTIEVVDIMDKKFAKDMGVPDAVFGKIAQWSQQQGVTEGTLEEIDRRGFLRGLGAATVAGATNSAMAALGSPTTPRAQVKVPPVPQLPARDGDLGNGNRVTTNKDGTRTYSGGFGSFTYNAQGKAITYSSPNFNGSGQTIDLTTNKITQNYNTGPLKIKQTTDATGKQVAADKSYDLGAATVRQQTDATGKNTNTANVPVDDTTHVVDKPTLRKAFAKWLPEGSEASDNLVSTLNSFGYYSDNSSVYANDDGDKIARQGSNWKHQSGQRGTGAEELGNFLRSQEVDEGENWSKHNNKRAGGMSKKSVASYRRSHPGSKIQTAVTTKPSKLKKGSKAAARRKSFCARMRGMKKHRTGAKTARDPNSNINKSLRRWHCESIEELHELVMLAEQFIRNNKK